MQTDLDKMDLYLAHINDDARQKFKKFYETLLVFNLKINLVSSASIGMATKQHFVDSVLGLELCFAHRAMKGTVFDFGSGNGFPGLILGVLRPDLEVRLIERDARKGEFLKHVAGLLKASNIKTFIMSYEDLPKASVQSGVTRALGSLPTLLIQMNTLFSEDSVLYHFKSHNWTTELANCPPQVFSHWDIQDIGSYVLPESNIERFIVASKKITT